MSIADIRNSLSEAAPELTSYLDTIVEEWTKDALASLNSDRSDRPPYPKTVNDPILGPIELFPWETLLLDTPLLQRLRGIRQLGMAHLVYPGASHDRFSHTLGVVEIATRMFRAIERNYYLRTNFGCQENTVNHQSDYDLYVLRLAALLHDVGHCSFGHASEPEVEALYKAELKSLWEYLQVGFIGAKRPKASEAIAFLVILSPSLSKIFEHPNFQLPSIDSRDLPFEIASRTIGSFEFLKRKHLSGIISGPIDADKLDYMARDCHYSGMPVGLDVNRLIAKLEVVSRKASEISDFELKEIARKEENETLYSVGLSLAGLTAYEQMLVGRALLYDRVYYHHKVRAAEAMSRRMISLAMKENKTLGGLNVLFSDYSDDTAVMILGGRLKAASHEDNECPRAKRISEQLLSRKIVKRVFAFAPRFILLPESVQSDTLKTKQNTAAIWTKFVNKFRRSTPRERIHEIALKLESKVKSSDVADIDLDLDDIYVDLPSEKPVSGGRKPVLRTESGETISANLFFDPEKWSDAFLNQKHSGFVFAPSEHASYVALASMIVFYSTYGIAVTQESLRLCKLDKILSAKKNSWLDVALENGICDADCATALKEHKAVLLRIEASDLHPPEGWNEENENFSSSIAKQIVEADPEGMVASVYTSVLSAINHMFYSYDAVFNQGLFAKYTEKPNEKQDLQKNILVALRSRCPDVREGEEIGGGETDIVFPGNIVLENKVIDMTEDAMEAVPNADYQTRAYSVAMCRKFFLQIIAFKPKNSDVLPRKTKLVKIYRVPNLEENCTCIRFALPWGYGIPSSAKSPV